MLHKLILSFAVAAISMTLLVIDADAARLGGGRSIGMQRSSPAVINKSPTYSQPAAINQSATNPTAMANNQVNNKRSWAGPLAGLAAGLGLGMLLSHFGFGEGLGSFMQLLLMAGLAYIIYKLFFAKKIRSVPSPMQYAGNANYNTPSSTPAIGGKLIGGESLNLNKAGNSYPLGFNAETFTRAAKVNFIRLQTANDNLNLDDLREFTSPEMFAELKLDIEERNNQTQLTEVSDLEAEILEVINEENRMIASVLFNGKISENGQAPYAFQEVWHMSKPSDGSTGWVVAGIQA